MTRARWITLALVVALGAIAGAGALAVPQLVARRAAEELSSRTGCAVTTTPAELGLAGVTLRDTRLGCAFGTAELELLEVGLSWPAVLLRGGGPARLAITGGRVVLEELPSRRPRSGGHVGGVGSSGAGVPIEISELRVEIRGPGGELGHAVVSLRGSSDRFHLTLLEVETAESLDPIVSAASVELEVERGEALRLSGGRASGVELRIGVGESLLTALRIWRRAGASDPSADVGGDSNGWEVLSEGSRFDVVDLVVRDAEGLALSGLDAGIERVAGARFRTSGRGQPRGEGEVAWDLGVDLQAWIADGRVTLTDVPLSVFVPFLPDIPLHEPHRALVSADATIGTTGGTEILVEGDARIEGLGLASARIASSPVMGVDLRVRGRGGWIRSERRLLVDSADVFMGSARAHLSGSAMMHGDAFAFDVHATLPSTPCDAAVHAIPAGLLQDLVHMRLEGRIAGSVHVAVDSARLEDTALRIAIADECRFVGVPPSADVARFQGPFVHQVLEPDDSVFEMETGPGTTSWTPISEVSPFIVHAVLAHEDASFFSHSGFAPWAIRDALVRNLSERRYVLGASTITMQLVKNVFLRREKTLARKVQEVLLTWWIESAMTKEQILELYLNVIEYGPSVYGIRQAASHYFGRQPSDLSVAESAYLAMILPNPPLFHEHFERGEVPASFRRRTERFVELMHARGRIDADAAQQGLEELAELRFSSDGSRVGPPELRGGSAQLPIAGFSGFPPLVSADPENEPAADDDADQPDDSGWEELWP